MNNNKESYIFNSNISECNATGNNGSVICCWNTVTSEPCELVGVEITDKVDGRGYVIMFAKKILTGDSFHPSTIITNNKHAISNGFAVLENAFILGGSATSVSAVDALMRGLGAGIMHGICTLAVGYGMSFVYTRRKLFRTGTVAMLAVATVYHATYNTIVQSTHLWMGVLLPVITLVLVLILMDRTGKNRKMR